MISIGKILKRSWHILWTYRILWIFGFLLALTTGGSGSSNGGGSSGGSRAQIPDSGFPVAPHLPENTPEGVRQFVEWFTQNVQPVFMNPVQHIGTILSVVGIVLLVALILGALAALVRYPTETAVIRMVDEYERSGSKLGFRQGWKLGWTERAFRMWLIDLLIALPILIFVLLILGAGAMIFFSLSPAFQVVNSTGVIIGIGLMFLTIFPLIVVGLFLNLLRHFFVRAAVLEDLGVGASLQKGWAMFKRNWKSAGLMWLVMVGIGIGVGIAMMIALVLLIPAYLVMLLPAAFVAALPGLITYAIASIFAAGPLAWIITILAALPFFLTVLFAPLLFVEGWYKIYQANVWTLTYREMKALESLAVPAIQPVEESAPQN